MLQNENKRWPYKFRLMSFTPIANWIYWHICICVALCVRMCMWTWIYECEYVWSCVQSWIELIPSNTHPFDFQSPDGLCFPYFPLALFYAFPFGDFCCMICNILILVFGLWFLHLTRLLIERSEWTQWKCWEIVDQTFSYHILHLINVNLPFSVSH